MWPHETSISCVPQTKSELKWSTYKKVPVLKGVGEDGQVLVDR